MKRIVTFSTIAVMMFALQNCSSSKKTNSATTAASNNQAALNGTWELNYISGPRIAFDGLYANKKPQLVFILPAMTASGNSSCNGFSAPIKLDGNKISFGNALSTMIACEGNGEQVFFSTLKKISSFSVSDNTLTLIMGDIAMMRFTKK